MAGIAAGDLLARAGTMPPEVEPFILAVVVALAAAWVLAFRLILRVGEPRQKFWVSLVTVLVIVAALGFVALITTDLVGRPRTIAGTVQSLGGATDRKNVPTYSIVVNGTTYWLRRTDYEKLQIGERIRGQAGAAFNFLRRVEVLPAAP
jgi:hypothetical protein